MQSVAIGPIRTLRADALASVNLDVGKLNDNENKTNYCPYVCIISYDRHHRPLSFQYNRASSFYGEVVV